MLDFREVDQDDGLAVVVHLARQVQPTSERTRGMRGHPQARADFRIGETLRCHGRGRLLIGQPKKGRPGADHLHAARMPKERCRWVKARRGRRLLAYHPGQEAAHRMGLPAGRLHHGRNGRATRPAQQSQHRGLLGPGTCIVVDPNASATAVPRPQPPIDGSPRPPSNPAAHGAEHQRSRGPPPVRRPNASFALRRRPDADLARFPRAPRHE
jgi:hypothetical protein